MEAVRKAIVPTLILLLILAACAPIEPAPPPAAVSTPVAAATLPPAAAAVTATATTIPPSPTAPPTSTPTPIPTPEPTPEPTATPEAAVSYSVTTTTDRSLVTIKGGGKNYSLPFEVAADLAVAGVKIVSLEVTPGEAGQTDSLTIAYLSAGGGEAQTLTLYQRGGRFVAAEPVFVLQVREEGGTFYANTEKGEQLTAPAVTGLMLETGLVNGVERITYRAEAGNPYGLEVGAFAGYFYPDTYHWNNETQAGEVLGGVVLHAAVTGKMMRDIGSPDKVVVIPLPIDPTKATKDDDPAVIVQETVNTAVKVKGLFFGVPRGSKIVNSLPPNDPLNRNTLVSPQDWGTFILLGLPSFGADEWFSTIVYDSPLPRQEGAHSPLGKVLAIVGTDKFTNKRITDNIRDYRDPQPTTGINLEWYTNSPTVGIDWRDSVLKLGRYPVMQLDNEVSLSQN